MAQSHLYRFQEYAIRMGPRVGQGVFEDPPEVREQDGSAGVLASVGNLRYEENHRAAFGKFRTFTETLQISLNHAFKFSGIPGTPDDVTFMTDLWDEVQPYPDTAPALTRLQEITKILIYSNVETRYLDMMVKKLGDFRPDFVGDMDKSQSRKPSPRAYRWVLETAGKLLNLELDFPDVMYIAGPQWDVQGAMALGMKGVWIHRSYRYPAAVDGVEPDYQVDDLREVIQIVEGAD